MLSKTRKNSPIRLAGGLIGVSVLTLAALGLTASGTQAAETIKSNVEAATGITLGQDAPPPPEPRAAPTPGAAPRAPQAPEAPKAPRHVVRVITTDAEHGDHGKGERRVVVVRDGRIDIDGARVHVVGDRIEIPSEAEILAMTPEVRSANCRSGNPHEMTVTTPAKPGQRQRIMVCVNRIERSADDARRMADGHRGIGMRSAIAGLRHAREEIQADDTLSPDQKREALSGIDSAIREVEQNQKD